jgi:hypothetical protein
LSAPDVIGALLGANIARADSMSIAPNPAHQKQKHILQKIRQMSWNDLMKIGLSKGTKIRLKLSRRT